MDAHARGSAASSVAAGEPELERVSEAVGRRGKTRQRVRCDRRIGSWSSVESSVNGLIEDLLWPTAEVTRSIAAVAKGDLTQTVPLEVEGRPVEGEFLRSAQIVNRMIWATVRVRDNGRGIAEDMLERVFELFAQDDSGSQHNQGLGIGLALARGLVELHGGRIAATSAGPGTGSEFAVRLPRDEAPADSDVLDLALSMAFA